ncbi:hypothetical protein HDE_11476 [Halotydeus destructor]|nr:hypothetical protein HDE_11476 [Halotydeus destructor]
MPPSRIEHIYDLFHDPEFKDLNLMMFSALHFYTYLLTAPKGTVAFDLYSRMAKTDDCKISAAVTHRSFLELDLSDARSLTGLLMFMSSPFKGSPNARKGLLVDKSLREMAINPAACIFAPEITLRTSHSRDSVVADYATMFYSKNIDEHLMKYVNYRTMAAEEADLAGKFWGNVVATLDSAMPTDDKFKRFRCMYNIKNENANEGPPPLDLTKFRKTLLICLTLLFLSLMAFCRETSTYHIPYH